jgi:hypothetical protein
LLVALGFLVSVVHAVRHLEALLEEVETHLRLAVLLVLNRDLLVDAD